MQLVVRILCFLVPHFRTIHYLRGVDAQGNVVRIYVEDPEAMEESHHRYIHGVTFLALFGRRCFPTYFAYQSPQE